MDQRIDAHIPFLISDRVVELLAVEPRVLLRPRSSLGDFGRVRGGHQHLGQQGIGIERNGRNHLLKLRSREVRRRRRGTVRRRVAVGRPTVRGRVGIGDLPLLGVVVVGRPRLIRFASDSLAAGR